jgi:hypothetical protein
MSTRSITSRRSTASQRISAKTRTGYPTSPTKWTSRDGVIWVYGVGEDGVMAFTDFGIENLVDLIKMRKDRTLLNHRDGDK